MTEDELSKMSMSEQTDYWKGAMLMWIGKGNMEYCIHSMIHYYSKTAYERGRADLLKEQSIERN